MKPVIPSTLIIRAALFGGTCALFLPVAAVCHAQSTAGEWDPTPWNYSSAGAVVNSSVINSDGSPSVGLSVTNTVSGDVENQVLNGLFPGGYFASSLVLRVQPGASSSFTSVTELSLDQPVDFGPAAGQSVFTQESSGFGFILLPFTDNPSAATVTVSLEGGAVFGGAGGSAIEKFELVSGGAGFDTATFVWNPALSGTGGVFRFDAFTLLGNVTGVTVSQSFTRAPEGSTGTLPNSAIFQISSLPAPEPSAALLALAATAGIMTRRRRTAGTTV